MSDLIIAKIAKLMINAKTRTLVAKIVDQAMKERARDIMITLEDNGHEDAAEMIASNWAV